MEKLGPRWDTESSDRFYKAYQKFGKEWAMVATRVPGRSPAMVKAMYRANRAFLSLPDSERTCICFQALVKDMYNRSTSMDTSSDESVPNSSPGHHGTRSGSKTRKGSARRGGGGSKQRGKKSSQQSPMLSDDDDGAKGRKRKRELFPDSPHTMVPMGKRKRKTHTTAVSKQESSGLDTLLAVMESPGPEVAIKLKTKFKVRVIDIVRATLAPSICIHEH